MAGATIMAIGTSFGDLMISVIALFVEKSTVGLGTIIGSELFNHLIISTACVFSSKSGSLPLNKRLFTREVVAYALTLMMMMASLNGGSFSSSDFEKCLTMHWYIGFLLMLGFVVYALVVIYFDKILICFFPNTTIALTTLTNPIIESSDSIIERSDRFQSDKTLENDGISQTGRSGIDILKKCEQNDQSVTIEVDSSPSISRMSLADIRKSMHDEFRASGSSPNNENLRFFKRASDVLHNLTFPARLIFSYTIPDVNKEEWRSYYPLAMLMSVAWLGLLAQGLLSCIDIVGNVLGLDPVFLGLTIGAWGASTPTLFGSMIVSKQGLGDMAISNALGANVFSVLVGLGLPWFLYPIYTNAPYKGIEDSGILPLLTVLIGIIFVYYIIIALNNYVVKFWMGYIFLAMYILAIALSATLFKS